MVDDWSKIILEITFSSPYYTSTFLKSLMPEISSLSSTRTKIETKIEGKSLYIEFMARDTNMLRVVTNTYLRWCILIKNLFASLEKLGLKE
jgi:tRNA threonylcarbamoyladenosine modification (KEOPS) complex  Pcc1 subunit